MIITIICLIVWCYSASVVWKSFTFKPVSDAHELSDCDNYSDKYGQLALAMLQQSEHIDRFYSPVYRTSLEQTEANVRWRNHRQRILNAARETGVIPKREPSYLKGLNIKWKGKKAFYTDEMLAHKVMDNK